MVVFPSQTRLKERNSHLWKEEMFLKARPLNKEQTYMRVNLCIVWYLYVIYTW